MALIFVLAIRIYKTFWMVHVVESDAAIEANIDDTLAVPLGTEGMEKRSNDKFESAEPRKGSVL